MRQLNENQIFQYNGSPITFQKGDSVMINATEMAKPFGKLAKDWLSNKSTKEFLSTLSAVRTIPLTGLIEIKQGGNGEQGTWMHEDVAMEFARWLSPAFAIWCNDRIKELLQYGMTATRPTLEQMINNPDLVISLATQLKNEREEKARLQAQAENQQRQISVLQPKAFFADCIMQSEDCISIGEMANILKQNGLFGKGQNSFFEWLRWSGYLLNRGSRYNLPSQRSMRLGIMRIAEQQRGSVFINRKAVITPYGQRYFIELFGKSSTAGQCTINFIYK